MYDIANLDFDLICFYDFFQDTELQKCEERLTADVTRYRGDSERSQEEINRMLRDKDITQNQIQVLHVSVQQRDSEISRLRDIVKYGLPTIIHHFTPS